jgi:DNA-directed RNA polymerase specialized sigma24 family protein
MSSDGSISLWINLAKEGNPAAAQALFDRYFPKLVRLARHKLEGMRRVATDEEDVALSAFKSFCVAAERGRFPDLADRDGLWRLLVRVTARKAIDLRRHEERECRGGGEVLGESAVAPAISNGDGSVYRRGIDNLASNDPTPDEAAILSEQFERLLDNLGDPQLQKIAVAAMEGYSNDEIALQLNCAVRTVERRRELIRKKWMREVSL